MASFGYAKYGLHKPRMPVVFTAPDDTKIYLHSGESSASFDRLVSLQSFLNEMMKFFPNFDQDGYMNGTTNDTKAAGDDGIGSWEDPNLIGTEFRDLLGGSYEDRYGDFHNVSYGYGDRPWGSTEGGIAENLDFSPEAGDFWHFEDIAPTEGSGGPIDVNEYMNLLYSAADFDTPQLAQINDSEWAAAQNYLNGFDGMSYYQIVMDNADSISFTDTNGDGKFTLGVDEYNADGVGAYKGGSATDAYYLMLAMLESRRRVFYAMSEIFGSPYLIANDDSHGIIDEFDSFMDHEIGGADSHNKRLFYMYFAMQHHFRWAMAPLSSIYTEGDNLNPFTAKDTASFAEFREWMNRSLTAYEDSLYDSGASGEEIARFEALRNEFDFTTAQPYGRDDDNDGADGRYIGWDRYCSYFSANNNYVNGQWVYPDLPVGFNVDARGGEGHPDYVISQIIGVPESALKGLSRHNGINLHNDNWAAHAVGTFFGYEDKDINAATTALALTFWDSDRYKKENTEFRSDLRKAVDEEYYKKVDEAQANKRQDISRSEDKAAAQKRRVQLKQRLDESEAARKRAKARMVASMFKSRESKRKR